MSKLLLASLFFISMIPLHANNAWYVGQVKRVALIGGNSDFVLTFKNSTIDDCKYKYVYFTEARNGEGRVKSAYTMALTSLTTGVDMGVVINKATNGVNGLCYATGMAADLRAN